MNQPALLDLFCGAGGATKGYQRAGFRVVGVDVEPQPFYCGDEFMQDDAVEVLERMAGTTNGRFTIGDAVFWRDRFAAVHASPPCQMFSQMSARWRAKSGWHNPHRDLLTPTLQLLRRLDVPYVVENVVGARSCAEFRPTLQLHGGMFGLGVHRPRLFETSFLVLAPKSPRAVKPVGVYGAHPSRWRTRLNGDGKSRSIMRVARALEEGQAAMGMDWADWRGTKEAIPPAYTEYIGRRLRGYLNG